MGRLRVRSGLVPGVQRAGPEINSRGRATTGILWALDAEAMPGFNKVLCARVR